MKHYPFGSSTAARTDACQQWREQCKGIPQKESEAALDGTIVHSLLEQRALADDYDFYAQITLAVEGGTVTEDHADLAQEMWAAAEAVMDQYGVIDYEPEVTGIAADDVGGTLDLVCDAGDVAVLVDFKSGMGVQVDPENNKQILFAAATCEIESSCADMLADKDNFVGVIIQPDRDGAVRTKTWAFTRDDVDAFWDRHIANIKLAREGKGALCAGDHCRFCPANGLCDATNGNLLRIQQIDPADKDQLLEGLAMIEQVKQAIANLEKIAYEQLEVGVDLPGWKLVAKRANRQWKDEKQALAYLRRKLGGKKQIVTEKLLSPAQMEKLAKKQGLALDLEELVKQESSGTTLAPASDKREAVLSHQALGAALAATQ